MGQMRHVDGGEREVDGYEERPYRREDEEVYLVWGGDTSAVDEAIIVDDGVERAVPVSDYGE